MEAIWELLVSQLKLIKNCNTYFITLLIIGVFVVVNGVVVTNSCNPRMLWCVVYHLFVVQVDAKNLSQGKNKRLLSYNKYHGTNLLEKHTYDETS
jgi:hypothetical protein